jgi:hypothetical protein
MTQSSSLEVSRLLQRWGEGDPTAFDELVPVVYDTLHELAHARRRRERPDLSLNTTALVHEAYLKLANSYQLWSETYERELNDIFVVQDEIHVRSSAL